MTAPIGPVCLLQGVFTRIMPLNGLLILQKALHFTNLLGNGKFQASVVLFNGVFGSYRIVLKVICGEKNNVLIDKAY